MIIDTVSIDEQNPRVCDKREGCIVHCPQVTPVHQRAFRHRPKRELVEPTAHNESGDDRQQDDWWNLRWTSKRQAYPYDMPNSGKKQNDFQNSLETAVGKWIHKSKQHLLGCVVQQELDNTSDAGQQEHLRKFTSAHLNRSTWSKRELDNHHTIIKSPTETQSFTRISEPS